jgi:ureidoacrylate peracid hydrolase
MKTRFDTRPEAIEIDLRSAGLVVVDMQNAFTSKGGVFDLAGIDISQTARVIDVIGRTVRSSRKAGIPVIYLQMGFKPDLSDSGGPDSPNWHKELALLLMRNRPELKGKLLTKGTWDFEIVDELKPYPGDLVVVKSRYSGFAGTQLDSLLRARQIRFLFFTGVAANVCVESTLRDAFFLDYWPILITDATTQAGPAFLQQATVQNVENHFGWTLTSQEFLETLERSRDAETAGSVTQK